MLRERTEQRKLAAIMFTDMVGYSALVQRDEALALDLLEEHHQILRPLFTAHHGHEVKTMGDGFLVEFDSALAAVRCAIGIQETLAQRNRAVEQASRASSPGGEQAAAPGDARWSGAVPSPIRIRIGIHVDDVVRRDGDIFGDGVNIAARIEPLAEPGGICITQQVLDHVRNRIEYPAIRLEEAGLKNIQVPVTVYKLLLERGASPDVPTGARPHRSPERRSVAVLPFVNLGPDRENEFLSDGISEDLITTLSQVKGLRVPARTSSFAFRGRNEDVRKIGRQLDVGTVLEGSVQRSGDKLRVTAQLINAEDGYLLWSARYDRQMEDVFSIQDDITRAIVEALKLQLGEDENAALSRRYPGSTEAYELYLRGRTLCNQRGLGLRKALHYFELALLEDPGYALAHAGLADCYELLAFHGYMPSAEAGRRARAAAQRALELGPSLAETHTSWCCVLHVHEWDWPASEEAVRRALALNPNHVTARYYHAAILSVLGRHDEAIAESERAIALDPLSPLARVHLAWRLIAAGRFDRAIEQARQALEMNPNLVTSLGALGTAYEALSMREEALATLELAVDRSSRNAWMLGQLGGAYARAGMRERALELAAELQDPSRQTFIRSFALALVYAGLGVAGDALDWLERARAERDAALSWIRVFPWFRPLEDEPRFRALLEAMGLG